jgi:2-C-methyl-D-erythritol 2,4-cyclodiphosphate synthase
MNLIPVSSIGQDSHRFYTFEIKPLILGGTLIPNAPGLLANSDGDVVLHAVANAVSGLTGVNILGEYADRLCLEENIKDSSVYLSEALKYLNDITLTHISISIECSKPRISPYIQDMKCFIGKLLGLPPEHVGITATSGEGLTAFGKGEGISVLCILTGYSGH